jgi:hypothetical protein
MDRQKIIEKNLGTSPRATPNHLWTMNHGAYIPTRMRPSERSVPVRGKLLDRLRRALEKYGRARLSKMLGIDRGKLDRIWKLRVVYRSTHEMLLQKLPP